MKFKIIFAVACLIGAATGVGIALIKDSKEQKEFRKKCDIQDDLEFLRRWQGKYNKKHYSNDFETDGPVQ